MAIAMTTGYSAQTEGALLCIEAASDWALTCVDQLAVADSHILIDYGAADGGTCLLYTSPSPRDGLLSRMPSSA